jgi:hypothetical protein
MNTLLRFVLSLLVLIVSCKGSENSSTLINFNNKEITQGIAGKVLWREGDHMPGPGNTPRSAGVAKEVLIYELTKTDQTVQNGQFFKDLKTDLVQKVTSDANGNFQVSLSPGTYSVFTNEADGYFANIFDAEDNIFPITVDSGRVTRISIVVDYKAVY